MPTHFSLSPVPYTTIHVYINDKQINPIDGFLGVLTTGTKIKIRLEVGGEVIPNCYTIDSHMTRTPKKEFEPGVYIKNLSVVEKRTTEAITTQIAGWPNNMVCLEFTGKTWNIGIVSQNGRYFLVVEEYTPPIDANDLLPSGMIVASSLLRGTATVFIGSVFFNARIHWTKMPWRKILGLRFLEQGEVINFTKEDVIILDGTSSFRYEIKKCALA